MKLKKVLVLIASLSLVLSITACGSNNNTKLTTTNTGSTTNVGSNNTDENATDDSGVKPEEGAKLIVWESKEERAFTDEIARQFTEKYGVDVEIVEIKPDEQITKLTQDGPSGLGGDVLIIPHDNLGKAASAGLLQENELFVDEVKKNNTEASIQGASYDGKLYGFPRAAETYAMYYNKSILANAPASFEEVIDFSKTFTDKTKNKYALMWEVGNLYFSYPFIASTGGYLYGDNGTNKDDIGINSDAAIQGLQEYVKLKEILPIKSGDINADIKRSLFSSGDIAMEINGPWELNGYKEALGDNLGLAPIPTIAGKTAISFSGIKVWVVNSFTEYPIAAQLFANFASSKDAQILLSEKVGSIPTNLEALESDQIKNDPYISAFAEQAKNSQPMPSIPEVSNVWGPINAALPEIWDNNKDPKASMDKAVEQIKDLNNGAK